MHTGVGSLGYNLYQVSWTDPCSSATAQDSTTEADDSNGWLLLSVGIISCFTALGFALCWWCNHHQHHTHHEDKLGSAGTAQSV